MTMQQLYNDCRIDGASPHQSASFVLDTFTNGMYAIKESVAYDKGIQDAIKKFEPLYIKSITL